MTTSVDIQQSKSFDVEGMTCNGCVNKLKKTLDNTKGIENAHVVLKPGHALVETSLPDSTIITIIQNAGFNVPERDSKC